MKKFVCLFGLLVLLNLLWPDSTYSNSEKRLLASFPAYNGGKFFADFEQYAADQFPLRDYWRQLKAYFAHGCLGKVENNDLYFKDGYLFKMDYPINQASVDHFQAIFADIDAPLLIIPDKNNYVDKAMKVDVETYCRLLKGSSLADLLSLEDYYYGDSHWRSERLGKVAAYIAKLFDKEYIPLDFVKAQSFRGVFALQSGISCKNDYLYKPLITADCQDYQGKTISLFNEKLADYDAYLQGAQPLIKIKGQGKGTLILFRDSFGSALLPHLATMYETIYALDLRYMNKKTIEQFVDLNEGDVLLLFSQTVINSSFGLK